MKNSQLKKISEKQFINCMESSKEFVLRDVAYNSNLTGTLIVQLNTEIELECSETCGFLTVGEIFQGKWIWNRRWCKIDGLTMFFWNYPQENMEKSPIFTIELYKCVSEVIELADRCICPKPRTFSMHIFNGGQDIDLYLLSADNQTELNGWMNDLNKLLRVGREWNI